MAVNESTRTAAAARVERLRAATAEAGLDAFVATADESIAYLTGFRPLQLERLFAVVVRADGGGAVVVPKLDAGQVAEAPGLARARLLRRLVGRHSGAGRAARRRSQGRGRGGSHRLRALARAREPRASSVAPGGGVIFDLRARKDEGEIEAVRRACALVEEALRPRVGRRSGRACPSASSTPGRDLPARRGRDRFASGDPVRRERRQPARRSDRPRAAGGRRRVRRHLRVPRRLLGRPHALRDRRAAVGLGARGVGARPRRAGRVDRRLRARHAGARRRGRRAARSSRRGPTSARCSTARGTRSASLSMSPRFSSQGLGRRSRTG